jgi:hypothetical protein
MYPASGSQVPNSLVSSTAPAPITAVAHALREARQYQQYQQCGGERVRGGVVAFDVHPMSVQHPCGVVDAHTSLRTP